MKQTRGVHLLDQSSLPSHDLIPYTDKALREELLRLEVIWGQVQASRERKAIYRYLERAFEVVAWWMLDGRQFAYARRALRMKALEELPREHPYASIIRCTADPTKVDKRTRSKWCRVMRYAAERKRDSETFADFAQRKGGINECASRAKKWLGRPRKRNSNLEDLPSRPRFGRTEKSASRRTLAICVH